ncbi:MAG: 4Fe-4S binding protein [Coriobacteriales bacterium]|jgi:ferredoxin-type protein NapH|nr:4Fe-4S binding protein [Coriobacteriales bacterium]
MKIKYIRWLVLLVAFVMIAVGLILNTNLGTLSSFGWQAIASICPLGVIESFLASKTIFPRALIVLAIIAIFVILLGKVFCAWVCPVAPVRSLIESVRKKLTSSNKCVSNCSTCSSKRAKFDSRHLVLGGSLLSALIFGFPVFCLFCPIGLIFGTVIVVWQFIGFEDVSLSLLIYPLILIVELLVLRKWCARFCPLGALLSLLSLANRFVKPIVKREKCLRVAGGSCHVCSEVCPEQLDPHSADGMQECSKCALCKDNCPSGAISIKLFQKKSS